MTGIYCFSGSGHSLAAANELSEILNCGVTEIGYEFEYSPDEDTAVVVFPVYCQNIPKIVKKFLRKLTAEHIVLIATYGRISYGNVLHEAQKLVRGKVIAGAYIPTGHTFLDGDCSFDKDFLLPIAERIRQPQGVNIPRSKKDFLAFLFPDLRSRIGVNLTKNKHCTNCGICENLCPTGAMKKNKINSKCIRCLRCASNCPQKALQYKNSRILNKYLKRHYKDEYILYL